MDWTTDTAAVARNRNCMRWRGDNRYHYRNWLIYETKETRMLCPWVSRAGIS